MAISTSNTQKFLSNVKTYISTRKINANATKRRRQNKENENKNEKLRG